MNKAFLIAAACVLLPLAALADGHGEIVTAWEHADYAADATKIADVHLHLHHSLNCLVGPGGNGFDAKEMNPCAHAGNGAIPDLGPDSAKFAALNTAAAKARDGIAETDLKKAQADAAVVRSMLNKAQ
jgi:hypothetical protein